MEGLIIQELGPDGNPVTPENGSVENKGENKGGAENPAFDEATYLKTTFGEDFVSKDAILERLKAPKVEYDPELLSIAEKIKKEPNVKALVDYVSNGGRDIPFFHDLINTDVTQLDSFSKVLKQAILTNKDPQQTPKSIEIALRKKYNMLENPRESSLQRDYFDDEKNEGQFALSKDAVAAEQFITELQTKARLSEPEKQQLQTEQSEQVRLQQWEPEFAKPMETIKIPNKVTVGDVTFEEEFSYELSPEEQELYNKQFRQTVANFKGAANSEQNVKILRDFTNKIIAGSLNSKITALAFQRGASSMAKQLAAKYSGIKLGPDESNNGGGAGDDKKVIVRSLNDNNGGDNTNLW